MYQLISTILEFTFIMAFFGGAKYSVLKKTTNREHRMVVPDGSWVKCKKCGQTLYTDRLSDNLDVCWNCNCHLPMTAQARIKMLVDENSFQELDKDLHSVDVLNFKDSKKYSDRLAAYEKKTGMNEAVVCGKATLEGIPYALGVMDFRFLGASMGSVVGEKISRLFEYALQEKLPVIIVTASGGARMQEGILSLMQMAKTCGAVNAYAAAKLPYIAILTDPTYGGVTASFATVADIMLAEPGAMIGFAGPRVIQETTNAKLPEGFQTAEFLQKKGLIDRIVDRKNLRKELHTLLEIFTK